MAEDDKLSLSVFTIEVDRKPVVAFVSRKYSEAEAICIRGQTSLRRTSNLARPTI